MAVVATGGLTVEVTAPHPAHGGLVDVLDSLGYVKDVSDPHLGLGINYEMPFCGVPKFAPGLCDDARAIPPGTEKDFDEPSQGDSLAFAIYKGIVCSPFYDGYEKNTTDALKAGASHAVEEAFQILYLDDAPVHGVATTFGLPEALAIAEEALADNVGSGGFISVGRYGATFLANTRGVKSDDNFHLWTAQGTPIINGGGISRAHNGVAPTATDGFFLYVTAPFTLNRGSVIYTQAKGLSTNTEEGLAEQVYAITEPCWSLAIEVDPGK
jgi:hypothetical protein